MKSGYLSSEFLMTLITVAGTIWATIAGFIPADLMVKIVLISSSVYTIARVIVKLTPSKTDDAIMDKIDEVFGKPSTTAPANTTVKVETK